MALVTNLSSAWESNESSGNGADSIGSETLTDNNSVGSSTGLMYPLARSYVTASSQYLSRADDAGVEMGDIDATFEVWFKQSTDGNMIIVGKDTDSPASSRDYTLDIALLANIGPTKTVRFYINGGGYGGPTQVDSAVNTTALVGTWCQVIAGHDAANNQLFISVNNETRVTTNTTGIVPQTSTAQFRIGARQYSGFEQYFNGLVGPARYWKNRVLSAGDGAELYNGGSGRTLSYILGVNMGWNVISPQSNPSHFGRKMVCY